MQSTRCAQVMPGAALLPALLLTALRTQQGWCAAGLALPWDGIHSGLLVAPLTTLFHTFLPPQLRAVLLGMPHFSPFSF